MHYVKYSQSSTETLAIWHVFKKHSKEVYLLPNELYFEESLITKARKTSKFATTLRPALEILAFTSATKVYKGTLTKINMKRTLLSHGNLHFTGSYRLEKFNETQRKYNVFILAELTNIKCVSSINHHYDINK